jgi:hypothetical protein
MDRLWTPTLKHAVQRMNRDGNFDRTKPIRPRAQDIPNYSFQLADGSLHQGSSRVPVPPLPAHASMLGDALEMLIPLGWKGLHSLAQHGRWSGWNDHVSIRTTLGNGVVDARLIVGTIADEGSEWSCDLIGQGPNLRAIIALMGHPL